ncbi:alpha/beta hydrolase [Undibacterium sp. TS12]|uniref:alpha/beta fold hydrolase n=1 Tax=Undibacterium sp. TS12 TaxID=2908202 RepID=UPI001F4CF1A1|nr:alpha/beta hydrolase [Undibacterium sp. TS12]MCH8618685.1 alpha/beta hydrolase [Undibacterium sp. TS12]
MKTIVLLPGMDGTGTLYGDLQDALAGKGKLIVARYPPDQVLDYAALEQVARSYLPVDEDYVLLGESFSGPIAISIAASRPERLQALVLCATFASNPHSILSRLRYVVPYLPVKLAHTRIASYFLLGRFATQELDSDLAKALAGVKPQTLKARLQAVLACDVRDKLQTIKVPTCYLRASEDKLVPLSAYTDMQKQITSMQLLEFEAPHFLLQTKVGDVVNRLLNFLE